MVALLKMPRPEQFAGDYDTDRRLFQRKLADGQAVGHRIDHTLSARQNPRLMLDLRDLSLGGMSALGDRPVQPGERLSVRFPRRGLIPGWDACGRVLRCQPSALGYRIAVEFDPLLAA